MTRTQVQHSKLVMAGLAKEAWRVGGGTLAVVRHWNVDKRRLTFPIPGSYLRHL